LYPSFSLLFLFILFSLHILKFLILFDINIYSSHFPSIGNILEIYHFLLIVFQASYKFPIDPISLYFFNNKELHIYGQDGSHWRINCNDLCSLQRYSDGVKDMEDCVHNEIWLAGKDIRTHTIEYCGYEFIAVNGFHF